MRIGQTRSGTQITYDPSQDLTLFRLEAQSLTDDDLFDFYCVYQWQAIRSKRKYGEDTADFAFWEYRLLILESIITIETKEQQMADLGLKTSPHLVKFGKKMVDHFWRE